eukprot:TRINITY_DN17401_c0_g1_i1.p1 TRINITY_DN17401_c0_g1~~TRINITY_DN17401_c0_g1_i1.p1  ORF type:complete len:173 (+),score=44.84 TRINITY_DN17401_c0_g1_i1:74-520(+)
MAAPAVQSMPGQPAFPPVGGQASVGPTAAGVEHFQSAPVAQERANFAQFSQLQQSAIVRVVGKLHQGDQGFALKTTDGGMLPLQTSTISPDRFGALMNTTVELMGQKTENVLNVVVALPLPGELDSNMWDEFVKLQKTPQLRHLFSAE